MLTACHLVLKLMHNKIQNRKQRRKNGIAYSLWEDIISGVPRGLILRPLLFNSFMCELFLSPGNNYFTNYADDTTPYVIGNDPVEVISKLRHLTQKLFA